MRKYKKITIRFYEDECDLEDLDSAFVKKKFIEAITDPYDPDIQDSIHEKATIVSANQGRPKKLQEIDDIFRS